MRWFYLTALAWLTIATSEEAIVKSLQGAQTVQVRDNNQLLRTQYLPAMKKQVNLEVLGKVEPSDSVKKCDTGERIQAKMQNSTYETLNGKMYKVTRVKKKRKKNPCEILEDDKNAQRRISNTINNWPQDQQVQKNTSTRREWSRNSNSIENGPQGTILTKGQNSFYNILAKLSNGQWQQDKNSSMDRIRKQPRPFYELIQNFSNGDNKDSIIENLQQNNGSEDRSWQFWTSTHPVTQTVQRKKEKLQKLLNLFTIVKFDNGGCYVDGLKGTCYTDSECFDKGGRSMGPCAQGFGVCCYIERTCGQLTSENCTYFVNDGFPAPSNAAPGICALNVEKAHPDVRQLRLEFETFQLRGPANGTCLHDRFLITGQNRNSIVPDLCGVNTGQHLYVDVDAVNGPFNLNVVTMGQEVGRKFRIKVTQLRSGDSLLAPQNCLQYFTQLTGNIESFNYQNVPTENIAEATPGYMNNMNYEVCIKKASSFCTVTYSNQPPGEPESIFQLINYDEDGEPLIPRGQAGAEVFNCPDDYIIVNGLRLCGDRLNDASRELDYTVNHPVTDERAGPGQLTVRTNEANVGRGFRLTYKQNPCID